MKVHIHDIEGQPILLAVSALRSLKAVTDFEHDQMVLKAVGPRKAIALERAPSVRQVFPLASDIMALSSPLDRPLFVFLSFLL